MVRYCKGLMGVDWNELRELWLLDPRINKNHTLVFERDRGYGGKCFPKDVKAIIKDSEKWVILPT
jgi:Predicted UDP-glucose 6-dehydrogenase